MTRCRDILRYFCCLFQSNQEKPQPVPWAMSQPLYTTVSGITIMRPTRNTVHHLTLNYICTLLCKCSRLFFDFLNCNDGGSTLLRNSGNCLAILNLYQHCRDNLKSRTSAVAIMHPTNPHQPVYTLLPKRLA